MTGHYTRRNAFALLMSILLGAGCASTTQTGTETAAPAGFNKLLVIGVAEDYEGRSRFERKLASELSTAGTAATAHYAASGGNREITREQVLALIEANGFDGVLITRVLGRDTEAKVKEGSASTKAVRRDGRPVNLFRYDYKELNEPATVNFNVGVTIVSELYAVGNEDRVWEFETAIAKKEYLDQLINEASSKIVRQLKRDDLIGR